jgi:phosphatidylserine/phosphatidylglycerophosphate/cardiolipin synthase-like enzyme/outer membrane protein OmpA-like peptidoglycan-associated protein
MNGNTLLVGDGPFVRPEAAPIGRSEFALPEVVGPFVLPEVAESARRPAQSADRNRYAQWSDADDRARGRNPREQLSADGASGAPPVLVYPALEGSAQRVFVLQNFKIDGAALQGVQRAFLAELATWMARGKRWRVFAEAHASRTGSARHDDALSEDRYLAVRAFLETELARRGVDLSGVRIAGEGVGFRHSSLPGEDPMSRSVYVVVQADPSALPPVAWPPRAAPTAWPPIKPAPAPPTPVSPPTHAAVNPPRWGPILSGSMSSSTALRRGNAVRYLIDGKETFESMVHAIRTAHNSDHYIYMLNGWQLVDDFELIPGNKTTTFTQLMIDASALGVQIRAMLWAKPGGGNLLQTRRINKLKTGAAIRDDETLDHVIGGHHQKILVVKGTDGLIGFCGGIDINKDRIAVVGGTTGEPLHDVHARIVGPSSWDVLQTFIRRWDHHPDHASIDKQQGDLLGRRERVPAALSSAAPGTGSSVAQTCSVVIARTFNPVTKGSTAPRERDIRDLLLAGIRNAQRFIYIEDQYLLSIDAAKALNAAVPRLAHVTILIPGSEATGGVPCIWKYRKDFIDTLTAGLSPTDLAKARVFQRVSKPITHPPTFGWHTYIHAKTWVFDDELSAIGSANVNRRGWEHDSEAEAFTFDDSVPVGSGLTFSQKQRMDLWAEHLGLPAATFVDGVTSAAYWLSLPPSASVMRYDPRAERDKIAGIPVSDARCDSLRDAVDPDVADIRTA